MSEVISYVSQSLDAFVRARDLLSLFSEVILNDLLPLCYQVLLSNSNNDEFSLSALCVLNELLNEMKTSDCVLAEHLQRDIKIEFENKFFPLVVEQNLLKDEPIALLALRFIQKFWSITDSNISPGNKFIPNLFLLIKDKTNGTFVQTVVSCLNTISERRQFIQTMIDNGFHLFFSPIERNFSNVDFQVSFRSNYN